jgi:hypothetical protein
LNVNGILEKRDGKWQHLYRTQLALYPRQIWKGSSPSVEEGTVLLWALCLCLAITVCVSVFVVAVTGQTRVVSLRATQRQTYTMARGEARKVISLARLGQLVPGTTTISYPIGSVDVSVVTQGPSNFLVKISAHVSDATDVISFTFNRVVLSVTDWSDTSSGS